MAAKRWMASLLAAALILFAGLGCRSGVDDDGATRLSATSPAAPPLFSGQVTDQQGKPVEGARVEINGDETRSGTAGEFRLAARTAEKYILNISHRDFADLSYISRFPIANQRWALSRAQSVTVDPKTAITLTDNRPELRTKGMVGATFALPPDSLVDDRGNAPSGTLRATIATLDVANGEGPGDWAARTDDGQDAFLVSYGAVFIQFTDTAGKRYQLRSGKAGQLSLPVIPNMVRHAPNNAEARFWFYDLKDGTWKSIGPAKFNPSTGAYTGAVTHLSTINTDIAKTNASCLKVTVDPSVAPGLKLRIRYHSGGTPFGQTPILVMNDPVNAVFRLPSNTNVLLELLDAANHVFGNLVVEDPVGTPTVNNVVNTGPAIPAGHTLWPGPPYTDCHPVLLRLGLPQVELRINEMPGDPAAEDDPTDDYITWAPTFGRARLTAPMMSDVNVVLTNDPPGQIAGGGDVNFAAFASPWPANTTATNATLPLTLPANGDWVEFVIAGKFGSPSTNDKDAIIEAHLNTAGGALIGRKALMVRVRKNANNLTASERARLLFAMRAFRNKLGANFVRYQEMHRLTSTVNDQGHMQPAFFPWHRAMLLDVERELQKIDPSVALPYWNWDAAAPNVFDKNFMGEHGVGGFIAKPVFAPTNPLNGWNTDLPFASGEIRRNTDDHKLAPVAGYFQPLDSPGNPSLIDHTDYGPRSTVIFSHASFSDDAEELAHNPAHGWPCAGGHLTMPVRSAADPMFYLLHTQVDRQWAYWQWKRNRYGTIVGMSLTFPAPAHYDNNGHFDDPGVSAWRKGSFLEDGMWPWDGTSGGAPGRAARPVNQATSPGTNVPLSMPMIPMTPFPASPQKNLWPAIDSIPSPKHMIDYFGRFRPQDGLGFCYDDVPY